MGIGDRQDTALSLDLQRIFPRSRSSRRRDAVDSSIAPRIANLQLLGNIEKQATLPAEAIRTRKPGRHYCENTFLTGSG